MFSCVYGLLAAASHGYWLIYLFGHLHVPALDLHRDGSWARIKWDGPLSAKAAPGQLPRPHSRAITVLLWAAPLGEWTCPRGWCWARGSSCSLAVTILLEFQMGTWGEGKGLWGWDRCWGPGWEGGAGRFRSSLCHFYVCDLGIVPQFSTCTMGVTLEDYRGEWE